MKTSEQIADWILSKLNIESGDTMSPLKLQKLIYYCQAWHLAIFDKPLFEEEIQAWAHGPVVPSQYSRFSHILRNDRINTFEIDIKEVDLDEKTKVLLNEVVTIYGEHSASYLESLTHSEKPWIEARVGLEDFEKSDNIISKDSMKDFYSELNK